MRRWISEAGSMEGVARHMGVSVHTLYRVLNHQTAGSIGR
jgi:DNA-binding phage protein